MLNIHAGTKCESMWTEYCKAKHIHKIIILPMHAGTKHEPLWAECYDMP